MAPPIIFFNIGWMTHYQGPSATDPIQGGGRYVAENQSGAEEYNFKPYRKRLYGYVQPPRSSSIRLQRIGAQLSDELITGVTVVWTARHPTAGGTYVLGWYQNATVYRDRREDTKSNHNVYYHAIAATSDSLLLPPDARTLLVPRGKGGIGQSNVWYADEAPEFVAKVRAYIKSYVGGGRLPKPPQTSPKPPRQLDLLKRLEVERIAVELTWGYYYALGYELKSVEMEKVGWDLDAIIGKVHFKLEVKGISGPNLVVELTSNEYHHLKADRTNYRLCIVTEALTNPQLHIFTYIREKDKWISIEGKMLTLAEVTSARAYIV